MRKAYRNGSMILLAATCIASCLQGASGTISLTEKEYFEGPGFVFLVYHNAGSLTRGGLQMMQNGEWLLASDDVLIAARDSAGRSSARVMRRVVDRERNTATIFGQAPGLNLGYQLICRTDGERMFVTLKFDRPLDWSKVRQVALRMSLYPPAYFMKSFQGDSTTGVFPRQYGGQRTLLKSTRILRLAQEDPSHSLTLERRGGTLELGDERGNHPTGWFSVTAAMEPGSNDTQMELEIRPSLDPQWRRPAVIGISQVGYHPRQPKRAVLELDPREDAGRKGKPVQVEPRRRPATGQIRLGDGSTKAASRGALQPPRPSRTFIGVSAELLPDELLWVEDAVSKKRARVIGGELRKRDVQVGRLVAISPGAIPRFLTEFERSYAAHGKAEAILATAAAHHRLLWIHPFLDGNGRVSRLMSHAMLLDLLDTGGLWSVSRGLARSASAYKAHLANCDLPRRNDLDGRGNLSEEALTGFTRYFLETLLDQVGFVRESPAQPDRLRAGI